jgi:hypothetical protein
MFAAKFMMAAILAVGVGYAACPYLTLYRLGHAIHTGDAATLKTLVDWPAVREGIKEDICDSVAADPAVTVSEAQLPAFGASFVRGIAANAVDRQVTAEGLVDMTQSHPTGTATRGAAVHVTWAFFHDPTDFVVSLTAPGQREPIKLQMTLTAARWRVTRVWLPPALLEQANARNS